MFRSLKSNIDTTLIIMIISSVIGVAISYCDIYLYHVCLLIMLFFLFLRLKLSNYRFNLPKDIGNFYFFFLLIFLWYSFSIFWAPNFIYAFKYLFYLLCGSILSLSIIFFVKSQQKLDILFKALSFIFIIEIIIALFESFTFFQMPISRYSKWASIFAKVPQEGFEYGVSSLFLQNSPPTGFHWDTNDLELTMLLVLPFFWLTIKL